MDLKISQIDDLFTVIIDGNCINNVTDYKIISSAHDGTELELRIKSKKRNYGIWVRNQDINANKCQKNQEVN